MIDVLIMEKTRKDWKDELVKICSFNIWQWKPLRIVVELSTVSDDISNDLRDQSSG